MAISVGDAVLKITGDTKELDSALKSVDTKVQSTAKNMRIVGAAMVGVGTAIIASLVMATKAAALEQAGIERLRVALENVGIAYDGATGALEKWIDAQQQSTAFADDQQREALSSLIIVTGNLAEAQDLLTTAMDAARWKSRDLMTMVDLVTKVYAGDMGMLKRYGIIVDENADKTEALAQIQKMAAGQAEAYAKTAAGQMELLKNNIGDVSEAIGAAFLDNLTGVLTKLNEVIQAIKNWITVNPELAAGITIGVGILGLLLIGFGTFIMLAPGILAAGTMMGVGFTAMLGPIGLVIAGIVALIAIGVALWKNWDKIVDFFTGSHREMTKVAKKELEKQIEDKKAFLAEQKTLALKESDEAKAALKKKYGVLEGYTKQEEKTLMDLTKDAFKERERLIDRELDALGDAHDEKMRMIDEEYNAKMDALDAETNAAIGALEGQLSAMDAEDKATARSTEDQADYKRLQQIQNAITNATNVYTQMSAQKELDAFNLEMAAKQKDRSRTDKRESIQAQIAALREAAANQKQALSDERDREIQQETDLYNITSKGLTDEKNGLEGLLQTKLENLETERLALEQSANDALRITNESIANQEAALVAFHDREIARIKAQGEAGILTTSATTTSTTAGRTPTSAWQDILNTIKHPFSFQGFEGIIPGIPGTPIPAVVHAGEYIGQGGGNTVNIYNPVVRSDNDIRELTKQVSREMERMQSLRYG